MKKLYFCLLLLFTFSQSIWSAEDKQTKDNITFSLLTCSPGQEIYSLFGHTAIRYFDRDNNLDLVFNYGLFSFGQPFFIWRFTKGDTDYELGVESFEDFKRTYVYFN